MKDPNHAYNPTPSHWRVSLPSAHRWPPPPNSGQDDLPSDGPPFSGAHWGVQYNSILRAGLFLSTVGNALGSPAPPHVCFPRSFPTPPPCSLAGYLRKLEMSIYRDEECTSLVEQCTATSTLLGRLSSTRAIPCLSNIPELIPKRPNTPLFRHAFPDRRLLSVPQPGPEPH